MSRATPLDPGTRLRKEKPCSREMAFGGFAVAKSIQVTRVHVVLALVILVSFGAIAVLATALLLTRDEDVVAVPPDTPSGTASVESSQAATTSENADFGPTPAAEAKGGYFMPGLYAAESNCEAIRETNSWAIIVPGPVDPSSTGSPPVIEVRGADRHVADLITEGQIPGGDPLEMHACVLDVTGAPAGVLQRMRNTRAIDGTLEESWPGYKVTWSYHPDTGLDAVFSYSLVDK